MSSRTALAHTGSHYGGIPMYCVLVTGIPAAGKSTMAAFLGERLGLPVLSKDRIKELLYDNVY